MALLQPGPSIDAAFLHFSMLFKCLPVVVVLLLGPIEQTTQEIFQLKKLAKSEQQL
jgi:hypothetical protein